MQLLVSILMIEVIQNLWNKPANPTVYSKSTVCKRYRHNVANEPAKCIAMWTDKNTVGKAMLALFL